MSEPRYKRRRCTRRQRDALVAHMAKDRDLALGRGGSSPIELEKNYAKWARLAAFLAKIGPSRTVEQWKTTWRDLRYKARSAANNVAANRALTKRRNTIEEPCLSEVNDLILSAIGKTTLEVPDSIPKSPPRVISIMLAESPIEIEDPADEEFKMLSESTLEDPVGEDFIMLPQTPTEVTLSEAMKIGFIGGGRLAYALANGFISAGLAKPDEITASCHPSDVISADAFKGLGATALFENKSVVERSEVVIVSVKPEVVGPALKEISSLPAARNKLFISVAMGVSTATIEKVLPPEARVIRVMPNTPALVKEGAAALCRGSRATDGDAKLASQLFQAVGTCDEVPEYQMDAVTALSGSGPAYVYMLIESLADGGVRCGLPRDLALRLATQTTLGSAAMLKNGGHPAAMKDNVTSPAGSTAEGTYHLEKNGFRAAVIGAVAAATDRCKIVNKQLNTDK